MRRVPVKISGAVLYVYSDVDDADYETVAPFLWYLSHEGYVVRRRQPHDKNESASLHRVIMRPESGMTVDHLNGDKLDNTRANLRICTNAENNRNKPRLCTNKSGYKGVHWCRGVWRAQITKDYRKVDLGCFRTPEAAYDAYLCAAADLHGAYACP